jgi:hypothetical protein
VTISSPTANQSLPGSEVQLSGTATDTEDGTISDRLVWSSSVDGALGTGATRKVSLSPGAHTITAVVQDSGGAMATATASVTVTVGGDDGGAMGGCAAAGGGGAGLAGLASLGAALAVVLRRRRR